MVILSIVLLVFRSCYTVYWEERQKELKKRASDLEEQHSQSESTDNLFDEPTFDEPSYNDMENITLLEFKRTRCVSTRRQTESYRQTPTDSPLAKYSAGAIISSDIN